VSPFDDLINWSKETFLPFGELGLFTVAFMESSFFPIPPDLLLIPLCLLNPAAALWFALICTAGSVFGALFGHWMGEKGGRPLLEKFVSGYKIEMVERYFAKYGAWAIGIAALTPIPYKVFTITSGILRFRVPKLIIASVIGRGARFFAEATIIMIWGEGIIAFMSKYFEIITLIAVVMAGAIYVIYKNVRSLKFS